MNPSPEAENAAFSPQIEPPPGAPEASTVAPLLPSRDPYPLGIAAQAVAIFAAVGGSLGLFISTLGIDRGPFKEFLRVNSLSASSRLALSLALGAGVLLGGVTSSLLLLRGRKQIEPLRRAADLLLPLALLFLLPSLFSARPWHDQPLVFLVQLAITVFATEWALRRSLQVWPANVTRLWNETVSLSPRVARVLPLGLVLFGSLAYAIYFSYFTILHHHRLGTAGFDLGININWCYNALHGHPARSTVLFGPDGGNFYSAHAIFGMFFWLPLYALHPGGEVLLIVQATLAGLAATTLYLFASTQIPRWSAVLVAYAYLLFAPLHGPNFYDFHELIPPLPFHFLLYWAIATRRNWLVGILVPVIWSFREDMPVGLTMLGLFLVLTGIRPRLGAVIALTSGIWFVLLKFVLMPLGGSWWFAAIYKDLQPGGKGGYGGVVQTLLINPAYSLSTLLKEDKLIYFLHMFAPLALLPARRIALLLLAIPGFAFSILTTGYPPTLSIAFQYTCHSIPYLFAASVLMLRVLGQGEGGTVRRRAALGAVVVGVLAHSYVFGAVLQHETFVGGFQKIEFSMSAKEQKRYATMQRLAAQIPQEASVAASETEIPHVAARMDAYTLKDGSLGTDPDFVLVNSTRVGIGGTRTAMNAIFNRGSYTLVDKGDDLYLFKRGGTEDKETASALRALGVKVN
jgi:uncharacterized membrane protein